MNNMRTIALFIFTFFCVCFSTNAQTLISGVINTDSILTKTGSPYLVNTTTIAEGATLTIEAGAVLKFMTPEDGINIYGVLNVNGTESDAVIFTSVKDDTDGTDSNEDGDATSPASGDWAGIWLNAASSGTLNHAYFRYGGGSESSAILNIYSNDVDINNCRFIHSVERGIYIGACSPDIKGCSFSYNETGGVMIDSLDTVKDFYFQDNVFTNNGIWAVVCNIKSDSASIILTNNSSSGADYNGFCMFGSVSGNVTFSGNDGFPFIVSGNIAIDKGAGITFTEGTVIKFDGEADYIVVRGSLITQGTSQDPVVFTSLKDDEYGGNTNSDTEVSAGKGDWAGVMFDSTSTGELQNSYFRYGGGYASSANLNVLSSDVVITRCKFDLSDERGVYIEDCTPDIDSCSFTGNGTDGIYITGLDKSEGLNYSGNTFTDNGSWAIIANIKENSVDILLDGNTSTGSAYNGFGISGFIAENSVLDGQPGFPFIVNGTVNVRENKSLSITAGTGIKFNGCESNLSVSGTLIAKGELGNPIYFTSLADDELGGDTNNDQAATTPAPGDWSCIWLLNVSSANIMANTTIKYAGGCNSLASINIYSSQTTIDSSQILYSPERGIYIYNSTPTIKNTSISENGTDGIFADNQAIPILSNNYIFNNGNYGIINVDGTVEIDARNTWWGHSSGPFHPSLNTNGQGNAVSDNVLFDPWNTATDITEVENNNGLVLGGIYPNPASGEIIIPFELEEYGNVKLQVINTEGKIVVPILDENRAAGSYKVKYNTTNLLNGTYFLWLSNISGVDVKRIIVLN